MFLASSVKPIDKRQGAGKKVQLRIIKIPDISGKEIMGCVVKKQISLDA